MDKSELRAAAGVLLKIHKEHCEGLTAEETRDRHFPGLTLEQVEERLSESLMGMARHILATVPADDRPHCPYSLIPMTINAAGQGPEMDPVKVVRTEWQVWDELNRCVAVVPPADDGELVTVDW